MQFWVDVLSECLGLRNVEYPRIPCAGVQRGRVREIYGQPLVNWTSYAHDPSARSRPERTHDDGEKRGGDEKSSPEGRTARRERFIASGDEDERGWSLRLHRKSSDLDATVTSAVVLRRLHLSVVTLRFFQNGLSPS
ncbi:hypothetical protein BT69DRAFT_1277797 [Atractiella rhizophila]|nr:hypothetical protein BT69DRAFT_1277797 [Atractiella rhizophila]